MNSRSIRRAVVQARQCARDVTIPVLSERAPLGVLDQDQDLRLVLTDRRRLMTWAPEEII